MAGFLRRLPHLVGALSLVALISSGAYTLGIHQAELSDKRAELLEERTALLQERLKFQDEQLARLENVQEQAEATSLSYIEQIESLEEELSTERSSLRSAQQRLDRLAAEGSALESSLSATLSEQFQELARYKSENAKLAALLDTVWTSIGWGDMDQAEERVKEMCGGFFWLIPDVVSLFSKGNCSEFRLSDARWISVVPGEWVGLENSLLRCRLLLRQLNSDPQYPFVVLSANYRYECALKS